MNNRRSLKENLTISNKQRFSIRKFSIGVASVMLGTTLYFMGGVGSSIVHADSVDQPVQTQTSKDINSAQASSDATLAQQDSDQNQSQVSSVQNDEKTTNDQTAVKSSQQATNASAAKSNTQDSKKAVSDTNETKSVANKAQISDQLATATSDKSSQQVEKTDTKNSNTLDIKQNKQRLAGNVKLNALTDNKAQTDTQTNSKYSVTDNYPADLTNYLPSTFKNTQEYAFEWLRTQTGNNIILTTNRTGDGEVYVYQDGKKVGTLAKKSSCSLQDTIEDIFGYDQIKIGTVYNDDYAGIVQSNNGYLLNIIYSSHAKDVDNAGSSYSTVSFFVPHKIKQTVTYKDSKGNVIDRLTHTQYGLTGQSYTTGLPSGPKYVRRDEYLDNITNNGSGLMSEFYDGYSCTKDYHDGVSVTFTEKDSEKTGTGTMYYVIYDGDEAVQSGFLAYGQSTNYTNYRSRYTIVNPYVPQTTKIFYQYKKLGQVITTDPSGNKTGVYYANDQSDPTKIEPVNAKPITGYSAIVKYENKIVSDKNFMPKNLGENTYITYVANAQKAGIKYIDDDTKETLSTDTDNGKGKFGQPITFRTDPANTIKYYEDQGYKLVTNNFKTTDTYQADNNKNQFEVHFKHGTTDVTPDKPKTPSDIIPGTTKHYPSGVDKDDLNKTVTRTINVISPDGKTTTIKQPVTLQRSATVDDVTGQITYKAWNTGKWEEYDTPQISGYTPSQAKVSATTVDGNTQDQTVNITYSANAQKATINYIDDTTGKTINSETINGHTGEAIADPTEAIANYEKQGYKLVSDDLANGASFDNDDTIDQAFYIHLNHDTETITPDHPKVPGTPINPSGDAKYPDGVDKESLTKTITRTINYVDNKGNKVNGSPDGKSTYVQTVTFTRTVTIDKVTGDIKSSTPWVPANGTWSQVNSRDPHELGYDSVDISTVGSKVVTSSSKDETITVTYSKDGGALTPTPEPNPDPNPQPQPSDPRNVPVPSTPTSHPTQPTNNKKDDENKDNNSNPKKRRNPNKPTVKTGSTRNNHPKINNNTSAKVANGKASKAAKTLPQTGENNKFGLIGLLFAALGVVFGLAGDRKRKN